MEKRFVKNPEHTIWATWQTAVSCVRDQFAKHETFTVNRFHEKCGIDFDTAAKYLPIMEDRDLGDGRKIRRAIVPTPGYVVDPPGEDSQEAARRECCRVCGCDRIEKSKTTDNSRSDFFNLLLSLGFTGFVAYVIKRSMFTCEKCRTLINITRLREPSFSCPVCGTFYVRQVKPAWS